MSLYVVSLLHVSAIAVSSAWKTELGSLCDSSCMMVFSKNQSNVNPNILTVVSQHRVK